MRGVPQRAALGGGARHACAALAVLALAGCGSGGAASTTTTTATTPPVTTTQAEQPPARPDLPANVDASFAGKGAQGAWILEPKGASKQVVLFLHGWTAVDPATYGAWMGHLVEEGNTVVYPIYQAAPFLAPALAFAGVAEGVRAAVRTGIPTTDWVVAGHSAGGAMSADYAVRAKELGLPPVRAALMVYPGRQIGDIPVKLPEADPADIPESVDLVALYGADDQTVGDTTAKRTIARAKGRLIEVTDPSIDDHLAPLRDTPATRKAFWDRLDALIKR